MFKIKNKIRFKDYNKHITPAEVLGMTSPQELAFLKYYAMKEYSGDGEIIDLGCWLGATTLSLAKGLILNKNVDNKIKRIHAFDLFSWESSLDQHTKSTRYENKFQPGDDYKWLFLENTKSCEQQIKTCGKINNDKNWDGGPIEFLFIDAMKNIEVTHAILKSFYPYLIPQKSLIVYQDFDHYLTPWIHLLIYKFRDYFILVSDVPPCGSVVFRLMKPIPDELLNIDIVRIEEDDADRAYQYCLRLAIKNKHANIAAAHVMYYYYHRKYDKAKYWLSYYLDIGYNPDSDLKFVKKLLAE